MDLANFLETIWQLTLQYHWVLQGLANTAVILVIGRVLIYGYREHAYLYQFDDRSKTFDRWISFLLPMAQCLKLRRYRANVALKLSRAGSRRDWNANHFIASQMIYAMVALTIAWFLCVFALGLSLVLVFAIGALGTVLPYLKLSDIASRRSPACQRDLPFFIDYLSLAMGAGLDFNQGLATVIKDAPDSPLKDEFALVLRNIRLGMSRADALLEMERRLSIPPLRQFVQTLVQGMELGTDVVRTLQALSEGMQQKRFQRAEEMAGKISVRMMIPMMCFVMPSVMIILLGPMMLAYTQAG